MFSSLEATLLSFAQTLPLEVFVFVASIVEEIIAPIPSPAVMVVAGSMANMQELALGALIPLAVIGAVGKTLGALVVYYVSDKAEGIFMRTLGRFLSISHDDVVNLGSKLGRGIRDYLLLTFLRALPIMPSVVVSAGSGILKVPLPVFIVSTFFGTIIRDGFYLYAGYAGAKLLAQLITHSATVETYVEVFVFVLIVGFILYRKLKNR